MNRDYHVKLAIAEKAAEWLVRLPAADAKERAEFLAWIRESPVHVRELLLAVHCAERLRNLDTERYLNVRAFIDEAQRGTAFPIEARPERLAQRRVTNCYRRARLLISREFSRRAAAMFAFVVLLIAFAIYGVADRTITTGVGRWHTTRLADGTVLRAGPRTKVTIDFTREQRIVRLAHGEALFAVAKDPARPFVVQTDVATARAIGTAFAVQRFDAGSTIITVKEGVVAVALSRLGTAAAASATPPVTLRAGEQVGATRALPLSVKEVDLTAELAWADERFVFKRETLGEAVREFNLRNRMQLRIADARLAEMPIRGVFDASDPESLAAMFERTGDGSVVREDQDTLLLVSSQSGEIRSGSAEML